MELVFGLVVCGLFAWTLWLFAGRAVAASSDGTSNDGTSSDDASSDNYWVRYREELEAGKRWWDCVNGPAGCMYEGTFGQCKPGDCRKPRPEEFD